jgi:hypothetical protein
MKKTNSIVKTLTLIFSLLTILMMSSCIHVPRDTQCPVTFPSKEYSLYATDISGMSYGWKLFCCIPAGNPKYVKTIESIWKKSEIPMSERKNYTLVNIKQRYGTDWSVLLIGQNYLSVTADIAKYDNIEK